MKEKINQWLQFKRYNFRNYDFSLVAVVFLLTLISSYILSIVLADRFSMVKQIIIIVMGVFIILFFSLIDYHDLCLYAPILYIITTIMAAATKLSPLGTDLDTDSYRWLDFKVITFQPSEVCKIVVILSLAVFFNRARERGSLQTFKNFLIACLITMIPTFFILIQSDLSSSVVIIAVMIMMLSVSGIGHKILGPVAAISIPVISLLFWYVTQPNQKILQTYQWDRIHSWLHPEGYELTLMYQQNNSILSIASGKLYGKLLEGTKDIRNYTNVGVTESDFVWTPISEEFGFVGCLMILILFSIIIIKCFKTAKNAKDYMGMMIASGIGAMLCFQTFFNIGVTTSLLPNTGLPLPFLSNGMTSLLSNMMSVGILLNIGIQPNRGSNSSLDYR